MWDKTKRAFDVMKERNRRYIEEQRKKEEEKRKEPDAPSPEAEETDEMRRAEEKLRAYREANGLDLDAKIPDVPPAGVSDGADRTDGGSVKLEKGDVPAMIISAFIVFGPVFLILFGILLLAWIFLH